jgi:SAM-dependent methyltransferase
MNASQHSEHRSAPPLSLAAEVRDFYDRYPYPRPVDDLGKYRRLWQDQQRRRADYHLFWPTSSFKEDQTILIAGCGTSQAAKHAMRWPAAQIIAIDVSQTSVACTQDLKRKYGLNNLAVYQLPVERVTELQVTFDQIVCTGVLHHLVDPDAGLRALRSVLKPEGAMHLMVYAPYGRTGIYMLQEFCRRLVVRPTDADIRNLITALSALPPGHPLENLLRGAPDFQQEAALADALLHPQDRAYSVPQLFDFLESAGLAFGRWMKQSPYSSHCGVMVQIPQAPRLASLSQAEQYAAVELFRGTMVRHSAVVFRNDCPRVVQPIRFVDYDWLNYVPFRMSETVCVQDRTPTAAAGVLINRSHTYTDLFLKINLTEKRWWEAIDGTRCVGDIIETAPRPANGSQEVDMARTFFERLWWYDQVVFYSPPGTSYFRSSFCSPKGRIAHSTGTGSPS